MEEDQLNLALEKSISGCCSMNLKYRTQKEFTFWSMIVASCFTVIQNMNFGYLDKKNCLFTIVLRITMIFVKKQL